MAHVPPGHLRDFDRAADRAFQRNSREENMRQVICIAAAFFVAVSVHVAARTQQSNAVESQCNAWHAKGIELHDAGKYDEAIAVYTEGLARCGEASGLLGEIGLSLAALGRFEEAADHFIQAVVRGPEGPWALGKLVYLIRNASSETRDRIMTLGTTEDTALRVSEISDEYVWMNNVACYPASGKRVNQALLKDGDRFLDRLTFECDDRRQVVRFFVTGLRR